jgi:ABC-type lipopolysaccharide export system ATPase subunit
MTSPAIQVEGLTKTFGKVRALDGIDMVACEGTVFGLLGPNGAGKTTAIRVLSTLLRPDSGRASVGGYDVVRQPGQVRRLIGLTGQYAAVDELLSGKENLYMIGRLLGLRAAEARNRAMELLDAFDLAEAAAKLAKAYSGRDAAAAGPCGESGGAAPVPVPGRANDGARSQEPAAAVGHDPWAGGRRHHRAADDPVPGGSRPAR